MNAVKCKKLIDNIGENLRYFLDAIHKIHNLRTTGVIKQKVSTLGKHIEENKKDRSTERK